MSERKDGFIDYEDLTPTQQQEVWNWLGATKVWQGRFHALPEVAVKLRADGHVSRRHSDRTTSTRQNKVIEGILRGTPTRRANDDIASGGVN